MHKKNLIITLLHVHNVVASIVLCYTCSWYEVLVCPANDCMCPANVCTCPANVYVLLVR